MSLRDYFAGQDIVIMLRKWDDGKSDTEMIKQWGKSAYLVADSLLAAREGL